MLFLTGGAGYIGAHIAAAMPRTKIVIYDNFSHAPYSNIDAILEHNPNVKVVEGDVRDLEHLNYTMGRLKVKRVIHCAGLKSVPEGERKKALYTDVNVGGTVNVATAAAEHNVSRILFSSSAGVYAPSSEALSETSSLGPLSHYGKTKMDAEQVLLSHPVLGAKTTILRYFNPIGALVVPDRGKTNLVPALVSAVRGGGMLSIFGTEFPTADGTAVRDYLPINMLATAHARAISMAPRTLNIGTGRGVSVSQLINRFQIATGRFVNTLDAAPRVGDVPSLVADVSQMNRLFRVVPGSHSYDWMGASLSQQWEMSARKISINRLMEYDGE